MTIARSMRAAGALGAGWASAVLLLAAMPAWAEGRSGNYLIVAARTFADAESMDGFVAAREADGFSVTLYSVPAGTSRDVIRQYVLNWYTPGTPGYILIVGDSDGTTVPSTGTTIPHWTGGGSHGAPTDLPYACMGGAGDWYPEVSLGRWPLDTVSELNTIVAKTLLVESGEFADPTYVQRAAFVATDDSTAQAEATHNWVISNYLDPAGFTSTRIYAAQGGNTAGVASAVNAGVLFAVYFGHSGFSGWWNPSFSSTNVQSLTNAGRYGLVLGMSCGTARFDWSYGECFGEYWIREVNKGAAAYLSSTTIIPVDWEPARRSEKYFFRAVFVDGVWEVGPAWRAAMNYLYTDPSYGPTHPDTHDYFDMFVLIGDPALRLPHVTVGSGDYDGDGDVDLADFADFQGCFAHSSLGSCAAGNLAGGTSINQADFALYAGAMAGPQ